MGARRIKIPSLCNAVLFVSTLLAVLSFAPAAGAAEPFLVTYVARSCPTYQSITANLARNNVQETLQNLGADSAYRSGQAINAQTEAANQPLCTPISDWRFTLGTGYQSRAVTGPWGALSIVTSPYSTNIVTLPSVPLRNATGGTTGQNIAGAVTVALTDAQANRAASPNNLWVQGGTPADPILNVPFPDEYGFGALRCGIDNLNGDNVEWIAYPLGARHVFCFAYYVKPPPTSGTIIVRKQVDAPGTAKQNFNFTGNISYNSGGAFAINAGPGSPGSATFYRAEVPLNGTPWSFKEVLAPNWVLDAIDCTSATADSSVSTNIPAASTDVYLAAGDTVTCTYSDRFVPPPAGLSLSKISLGGVGTFGFKVAPSAGGAAESLSATTTQEDIEAPADRSLSLAAGKYKISEQLPESRRGDWFIKQVICNGATVADPAQVEVTLVSGTGNACVYMNNFVPAGSIQIHKITLGSVGTTGFVVAPLSTPSLQYRQTAVTKKAGVAVTATGSDTSHLALGSYSIQETTPTGSDDGSWKVASVECNGIVVPSIQGEAIIKLTAAAPDVDCTYVDQFTAREVDNVVESSDPEAATDLRVVKSVSARRVQLGTTGIYTIKITNTGKNPAENVTLSEQLRSGENIVSVAPRRFSCSAKPLPSCSLGTIKAGHSVIVRVRVRAATAGLQVNRVAVNSSTAETRRHNNTSKAAVRVVSDPGFTG